MKKAIGITLSVIGIIMAAISLVFKVNEQMSVAKSVSVIGGADGPTSIFVAGKIGGTPSNYRNNCGNCFACDWYFYFCKKKINSILRGRSE